MLPLYQKALAFMLRGGYRATRSLPGFAELEYAGEEPTGREPRLLLWVEDKIQPPSASLSDADRTARATREDALIRHMISEIQATHQAVAYYLVPSRQGLSQTFVTDATRIMQRNRRDGIGGIRVPIEFFDTAYKLDGGTTGAKTRASAFAATIAMADKRKRVAQPFSLRTGFGERDVSAGAADIVEHLETALMHTPDRPILRIIDGPAGGGKSIAFEALAAKVYAEFMAAKQADILRPRPIVFLPEHIRGQTIGYVDDIIDAMTDNEAAAPVEASQLRFLLTAGHSIWMLDGLDEFFAGDNDFLPFLAEQLASPESRAQIVICTRDSLLSSSTALRGFIEHAWSKRIAVEIYELMPWREAAWRDLAWLELEHGRKGAQNSPLVEGFVAALTNSPDLSQLARLPFYCTVLLEQYRKTKSLPADSLTALDAIIDRMLAREEGKAIFQWRDFVDADVLADLADSDDGVDRALFDGKSPRHAIANALDAAGRDTVIEMLGLLAHQRVRRKTKKTADAGVAVADMSEVLTPVYLPSADTAANNPLTTALVQFAFFGAGRRAGVVDFTHPILAEYLAGLYAASVFTRAAANAEGASALSRIALLKGTAREAIGDADSTAGSVFERVLARELRVHAETRAFVAEAVGTITEKKLAAILARLA